MVPQSTASGEWSRKGDPRVKRSQLRVAGATASSLEHFGMRASSGGGRWPTSPDTTWPLAAVPAPTRLKDKRYGDALARNERVHEIGQSCTAPARRVAKRADLRAAHSGPERVPYWYYAAATLVLLWYCAAAAAVLLPCW